MAGPRQALEKHRAIELNDSWLMELILITSSIHVRLLYKTSRLAT